MPRKHKDLEVITFYRPHDGRSSVDVRPASNEILRWKYLDLDFETPESAIAKIDKLSEDLIGAMIRRDDNEFDRTHYYVVGWASMTSHEAELFANLVKEHRESRKRLLERAQESRRNLYEDLKKEFGDA